MVCINKVKKQIMKKAKWISFGCLLGIILATGSCKETLQNALGKDISVKNREIVFDVQPSELSQTDADGQDVPELLAGATEEVLKILCFQFQKDLKHWLILIYYYHMHYTMK